MRAEGIRGYVKKRRVRTTIPEPSGQKVPDLLKRDFTAKAVNERYVGDITYLPIGDGTNLYLATVIDCYHAGWPGGRSPTTCVPARRGRPQAAAATRAASGRDLPPDHGSVTPTGLRQALQAARRDPVHGSRRPRPTTLWPSRSTPPSSARSSKTPPAGPTRPPAAARSSLARPLQHPPPSLLVRLPSPVHLRGPLAATLPTAA